MKIDVANVTKYIKLKLYSIKIEIYYDTDLKI
jgi:hypothetical protein